MPFRLFSQAPATPRQEVAALAEQRAVHAAMSWFRTNEPRLRDWQLDLVQVAAPPFGESRRAEWLAERFREVGLEQVTTDEVGNVLGILPGSKPGPFIAVAAHIDTVFPAGAKLAARQEGARLYAPGVTDNAAGVVGLLALAKALRASEVRPERPLLFIGNVGEEGEGDLRGMRHLFASAWSERIAQTVVLDGAGHETLVTQALGSRRFEVTVRGPGGHSWSDFGMPNPIVALSLALARFSATPLPREPRTAFNVGVIGGGTSVNSIPESATARIDIRSAEGAQIAHLERALREAVAAAVEAENSTARSRGQQETLKAEIKSIGDRPAADLPESARIGKVVAAVDAHLGIRTRLRRASTDANIPLAQGREAVSLGAGGSGGGAHTLAEWYDPTGRDLGLKRVLLTVLTLSGVTP